MNSNLVNDLSELVKEIYETRYPQSQLIFFAGSIVRGEGTSASDLDLVVVFDQLPNAYRESFIYKDWPVEAFVHDPQTLEYFFKQFDRPSGFPSLASMVSEGIELPAASVFSKGLKQLAQSVIAAGPPHWGDPEIRSARYAITDLIEDMKDPRSVRELHASATALYPSLANYYFRSQNLWSAKSKTIPRRLEMIDPAFAERFLDSFEQVFTQNCTQQLFLLVEEILEPQGGFLFEGYTLDAPESWRV